MPNIKQVLTILVVVALAEALGVMDMVRGLFSGLKK